MLSAIRPLFRRPVYVAAACLAMLAGSMAASSSNGAAGSVDRVAAESTDPGKQSSLLDSELVHLQGIDRLGGEALQLQETFGALGNQYDREEKLIVIRVPADRPELVDRIHSSASPELQQILKVESSQFTTADIDSVRADLAPYWKNPELGGTSAGTGYNVLTDEYDVTSDASAESLRDFFQDHPDVRFHYVYSAAKGERLTRYTQTAPFIGGARISGPLANCTSGYTVKTTYSGTHQQITAGHCADTGDTFESPGSNEDVGTVGLKLSYPYYDLERYSGRWYSGEIYEGTAAGSRTDVAGAATFTSTGSFCTSGSFSFEICGREVHNLNAELTDSAGTTYNLVQFTMDDGWLLPGDSGAPAYTQGSTGVTIRGNVIARQNGWGYAHKWATVRDEFGVEIVTN